MSLYSSSKHKTRSNSKSSLGHLKLSVYEEDSCLVVEVHEGRCLAKKDNNTSETYVKIYLLPDPNKITKQKTKMCKGKNPTYNEKFNFILENGDEAKQLYVSVWMHDRASRNELIGCMSFKVEDILQSDMKIQGWYQLLDHERGLLENVKVPSLRPTTQKQSTSALLNHGTSLAVTLARGPSGYGFSVHSSTPVYITAIDRGLPAHVADVRVNDVIIELEGINVRHASGKQIVNIIRRCPTTLSMILLRCETNSSLGRSQSIGNGLTSHIASLSVSPLSFSSDQLDVHRLDTRHYHSNAEQISDRSSGSSLSLSIPTSRLDYRRHSASPEPLIQRLSSFGSDEKPKSNFEGESCQFVEESQYNLSKLSAKTNGHFSQDHQLDDQRFLSMTTLGMVNHGPSQPATLSYQHHHSNDYVDSSRLKFKRKDIRKFSADNTLLAHNGSVQLLSSNKLPSLDKGLDVRWESLTPQEKRRQKAIDELFAHEKSYCSMLRIGIQQYKEPIKSAGLLSISQIHSIFININELYEISNGICGMLKQKQKPYIDSAPLTHYVHAFADVYKLKWLHLRQNYEIYLKCFGTSTQELSLSLVKPEMNKFLQEAISKDQHLPTLHHIIEQPRQYLTQLLKHFIAVSSHLQLQSEDCHPITHLITGLLELCPDKQLVNKYRRQQDVMSSLKLRIGFSSAVHPIVIVTPGRVFVQEGEMILLEKRKKRKVWLLLFNNLLLITRKDGKIFTVQEEPILLDRVRLSDTPGPNTELQLCVDDKEIVLKASSGVILNQWQQKLRELLEALQPPCEPQASNIDHVSPTQQTATTAAVHVNVTRLNVRDDERSSPLAKMTRIFEAQKEEADNKQSGRTPKRKTLFNIGRTNAPRPHKIIGRTKSANVNDQRPCTFDRVSSEAIKAWSLSFDALLQSPDGVALFEQFLVTELSEENLQFWQACNCYNNSSVNGYDLVTEAHAVFKHFLVEGAPKQVNIDYQTLMEISENIDKPDHKIFIKAQRSVYNLMSGDSYKRFVQSEAFQRALKNSATAATP